MNHLELIYINILKQKIVTFIVFNFCDRIYIYIYNWFTKYIMNR